LPLQSRPALGLLQEYRGGAQNSKYSNCEPRDSVRYHVEQPDASQWKARLREVTVGNSLAINNAPALFNWVPELVDTCAPLPSQPSVLRSGSEERPLYHFCTSLIVETRHQDKNWAAFSIFFFLLHVNDNVDVTRVSSSCRTFCKLLITSIKESYLIISPLIFVVSHKFYSSCCIYAKCRLNRT
jgi:hypothetical protein